jgi:NAD(P)-dependent dehydrogenase (short-subunit alcohol dehydrogenase family)
MSNDNTFTTDLTGQVALVTGGSRGLGRAFAQALAAAGAAVAVTARTEEQLSDTVKLIRSSGGVAFAFPADVTDKFGMSQVIAQIELDIGPVDVLVNNAGVITPLGYDWEVDPDEWWRSLEVNLRGPFLCTRAMLPSMMARRRGRIVNISSSAAYNVHPWATSYCAAKAGLTHFTRCLGSAVKEYGISVFAYNPRLVRTDLAEQLAASPNMPEDARAHYQQRLDEGRYNSLEDAARKLMYLVSGKADRLSGRLISTADSEEHLARNVDKILEEDLYTLRLQR